MRRTAIDRREPGIGQGIAAVLAVRIRPVRQLSGEAGEGTGPGGAAGRLRGEMHVVQASLEDPAVPRSCQAGDRLLGRGLLVNNAGVTERRGTRTAGRGAGSSSI